MERCRINCRISATWTLRLSTPETAGEACFFVRGVVATRGDARAIRLGNRALNFVATDTAYSDGRPPDAQHKMRDDGLPFDLDELRTTQHPPHVHAQHREYRLPDYLFSNLWSGGPGCSAVPTRPPCETTTCDACRDQRVALCLTGSPRSFVRPHVYSAFKSHLIGGLDASTTDVGG